jgi:hypothetical protein
MILFLYIYKNIYIFTKEEKISNHRALGGKRKFETGIVSNLAEKLEKRRVDVEAGLGANRNQQIILELVFREFGLVSDKNHRGVISHAVEILRPVFEVAIRELVSVIAENEGAIRVDVVAIAQASEFFLSRAVPYVESDQSMVCSQSEGENINPERCDIPGSEIVPEMLRNERTLPGSAITDKNDLVVTGSASVAEIPSLSHSFG